MKTIVADESASPDKVWLESQRSDEVEPIRGFGVTDQDDPPSTFTLVAVVVSVTDFDFPFTT